MANNFEKALASYIETSAAGNFLLSDTQINNILTFFAKRIDYISMYGSALAVQVGKDGSKTILKDVKQGKLAKKTAIGDTGKQNYKKPKVETITIAWSDESNIADQIAVSNRDSALGFNTLASQKLASVLYDVWKIRQRLFFTEFIEAFQDELIAGNTTSQTIALPYPINSAAKAQYVWNALSLAYEKFTQIKDDAQHIDGIDPENIFMDARQHLITAMAQLGFSSGTGQKALEGGTFLTSTIADIQNVRSNPYIMDLQYDDGAGHKFPVAAILTTKFKTKFPYQLLKAHISEFDSSKEQVTYVEDLNGKDIKRGKQDSPTIVYQGLTYVFIFDAGLQI